MIERSKVKVAGAFLFAACMAIHSSAQAAKPLVPHRIEDMILLGQEGPSRSTVTRKLLWREGFLYASGEPGLQAVDARDPSSLRLTSDWTESSLQVNGSIAAEDILYLANWSPGAGLVLFDLANPARPAHLKTLSTAAHTWEVSVSGNLLDVAIDDGITTGIVTYDIADRRNPALLNFLSIGDRLVGNAARSGNLLYFTHKNWLRVYESKDPRSPRFLREIALGGLGGEVQVRGGFLFLLTRAISAGEAGGVHVYALDDPTNPREVEFWEQPEPRDLHFQGDFLIVPASGSGIYTLDVKDPADLKEISHWYVSWPGTGHGGYPINAAGAGNHVSIGTTGGNNPECEDFETCAYYGARVYSVRIATDSPRIAPVEPDPDEAPAGHEYFRQLVLLEGDPAPAWSVVRGPPGLDVDSKGLVRGWTPGVSQVGSVFTVQVRAANEGGSALESFQVHVVPEPEDLIAWHRFESGDEGWTLETWKSGPYDPGLASWEETGGNPAGNLLSRGSGATNNLDTCNREGSTLTRAVSTEGREGIRVEFEVLAELDRPPGASGTGSCQVLEGSSEDKLALYYSISGTAGPWLRALVLSEGPDLPCGWTRKSADLSGAPLAANNPRFALRLRWQFNTTQDLGRIDGVRILGDPIVPFRRGDPNGDGAQDISDPVAILTFLFGGGSMECMDAADTNDSGAVDISDAIYLIGASFLGGPVPPAPHAGCGPDPTRDALRCGEYSGCP